jgi:hypothetical protein
MDYKWLSGYIGDAMARALRNPFPALPVPREFVPGFPYPLSPIKIHSAFSTSEHESSFGKTDEIDLDYNSKFGACGQTGSDRTTQDFDYRLKNPLAFAIIS